MEMCTERIRGIFGLRDRTEPSSSSAIAKSAENTDPESVATTEGGKRVIPSTAPIFRCTTVVSITVELVELAMSRSQPRTSTADCRYDEGVKLAFDLPITDEEASRWSGRVMAMLEPLGYNDLDGAVRRSVRERLLGA